MAKSQVFFAYLENHMENHLGITWKWKRNLEMNLEKGEHFPFPDSGSGKGALSHGGLMALTSRDRFFDQKFYVKVPPPKKKRSFVGFKEYQIYIYIYLSIYKR